jgi:hypothetical protein
VQEIKLKINKVVLYMLLFVSCSVKTDAPVQQQADTEAQVLTAPIQEVRHDPETTNLTYDFVEYPSFRYIENEEIINGIIKEEVRRIVRYNDSKEDDVVIHYIITRNDENYLSIVFDGIVDDGEHGAHKILSCMIIDRKAGVRLTLGDIATIDDNFGRAFLESRNTILSERDDMNFIKEYYFSSVDTIEERLKEADVRITSRNSRGYSSPLIQSYLTDNELVLRFRYIADLPLVLDVFDVPLPLRFADKLNTTGTPQVVPEDFTELDDPGNIK